VLGSIITRQYRFATRGFHKTFQTARQAVDIAGGIAVDVAGRLGLHDDHPDGDIVSGEVVPESRRAAEPTPPAPSAPPAPPAPASPAAAAASPPVPPAAVQPEPEPLAPEPAHVSSEPVLVESFAERGAEDTPGAEIHIAEPWPGYRHLKARDVIARVATAGREELATVELFERAHANRKSVLVAAERALKKASPLR
jgi:hypothetical protein